jgi:hypothetical protein
LRKQLRSSWESPRRHIRYNQSVPSFNESNGIDLALAL